MGQRWLDALNSHNADQVVQLLAPGAIYSHPAARQPLRVDRLRVALEASWKVWKDQVYIPRHIVAGGGSIAIEWHIQQTSPSGQAVPVNGVSVLDVREGQIVAVRSYFDPSVYLPFVKLRP